ncbi:hypothetical protein ACF0RO_015170, partial [Acinetobacter baumannii]
NSCTCSSPQQIYGIRSTTYPSYALNLAQLGALCISNLCATKPITSASTYFSSDFTEQLERR